MSQSTDVQPPTSWKVSPLPKALLPLHINAHLLEGLSVHPHYIVKLVYDGRHGNSILRQFRIVVVAIGNSARGKCRTGSLNNEVSAGNSYHFRHVYCIHSALPCVVDSGSLATTSLNCAFRTPSFNQGLGTVVVAGAESDRGLLMIWLYTEEFWLEY